MKSVARTYLHDIVFALAAELIRSHNLKSIECSLNRRKTPYYLIPIVLPISRRYFSLCHRLAQND